jgi:hypothetical protein
MSSMDPGGDADAARLPICLIAEPAAGGVRVQVIGNSVEHYEATFSLQVEAGGNLSRHHGSASLAGGESVILSNVIVSLPLGGQWCARLCVESEGNNYEQTRSSQ